MSNAYCNVFEALMGIFKLDDTAYLFKRNQATERKALNFNLMYNWSRVRKFYLQIYIDERYLFHIICSEIGI